jgi:hypothetical protein
MASPIAFLLSGALLVASPGTGNDQADQAQAAMINGANN